VRLTFTSGLASGETGMDFDLGEEELLTIRLPERSLARGEAST
jgi:hypothetical protein